MPPRPRVSRGRLPALPLIRPRVGSAHLKVGLALALAAFAVAGCSSLYPPMPVTEQGRAIHDLYNIVFLIAAAIFIAVEGAILFLVLRYRRGDEDDDLLPEQIHGHTGVEVLWTVIPFVIVAFLFSISWQALSQVQADTSQQAGVSIKVIASQWCWEFDYLNENRQPVTKVTVPAVNSKGENCRDENGSPPTMVVPVGERIRLQLHSNDVIHAFYVPQFLSKLDVVPQGRNEARDNIFDFTPTEIGEFRGQCAEFCGLAHAEMQFAVSVRSRADYESWLAAEKSKPSPTPVVTPAPGASPAGTSVNLAAVPVQKFDQTSLNAPAKAPFVIEFDNRDPGQTHNVAIQNEVGKVVFIGQPLVTGPAKATYNVPALASGTYKFFCSVHPFMTGTLEVT